MYLDNEKIDTSLFMQGDIILGFDFPHVLFNNGIFNIDKKAENIILLSQSCDLQFGREQNETYLLCPLITEKQLNDTLKQKGQNANQIQNSLTNMKHNKKYELLYLPANVSMEDSFAVFNKTISLQATTLHNKKTNIRLSDSARHFLVDRLHNFLCRAYDPIRS